MSPMGLPTYMQLSSPSCSFFALYLLYAKALVGKTIMEFLADFNSSVVAPMPVIFY